MSSADLTTAAINTIRTLSMDAVQAANSGHPGMPMGCAPMAYVLFREVMDHDPADPAWADRDRFVLSAGHGSMLLYSALFLSGYERPNLDDIRNFRQWGYPTAGHPENFLLDAVETTTGPLGQGFANGVGMAIAEARLAAEFNRDGHDVVDHRTYAIVSDGDLMEGVASEAASLAGHLKLGKLVYLYDDNEITIDGGTGIAFTEDVLARFDAYGWHTQRVTDGNDVDGIRAAIAAAQADDRPSLIAVRTVIGFGSPNKAGTSGSHGSPLGDDEISATKAALGWDHPPFHVPDEVAADFDQRSRGGAAHAAWDEAFAAYAAAHPELAAEFERRVVRGELAKGWRDNLPSLTTAVATRKASGQVINALAGVVPELFGGSADLAGSNLTDVDGETNFTADDRSGRNLRFGVREHAMAAAANGMALHGGVIPYVATFLIFTDYCRPSIRLSALMEQRVIYVMTHDSIGLGEDGPTHQPIEQLAALRAIPGVQVHRPADGEETAAAWASALEYAGPTVIALTRQTIPYLGEKPDDIVDRGGYVVRAATGTPDVVLVGTGSEVQHCVDAAETLADEGIDAQVVSLPCWETFALQEAAYIESVIPKGVSARVSIEAGTTFGWERIIGSAGVAIGRDGFGASAPYERLMQEFGFTADNVVTAARRVAGRASA